jgi:hypothetical protein
MAKAPAGTKKTKDAITKAASQKKAGVKVFLYLMNRNGLREKQKKRQKTQYLLTEPLMIN